MPKIGRSRCRTTSGQRPAASGQRPAASGQRPAASISAEFGSVKVPEFLKRVAKKRRDGRDTEHTYRSAIEFLFESIGTDITATNEPEAEHYGAPDFHIKRGGIVIGYVEAKKPGRSIQNMGKGETDQQERYKKHLTNLIYTNCYDWDFYYEGNHYGSVNLNEPAEIEKFKTLVSEFLAKESVTINSSNDLAERMALKAKLIKICYKEQLEKEKNKDTHLMRQFKYFKDNLIRDIDHDQFADIYAQTFVYGTFVAWLHNNASSEFTRDRALKMLPESSPFMGELLGLVSGNGVDKRISWATDELVQELKFCDVKRLLKNFKEANGRDDPFIHFYETFLSKYNPEEKSIRGVWYTPDSVVKFIVRAVDEVLKSEFDLSEGLADTSMIEVERQVSSSSGGKASTVKVNVPQVQILDPATGTGTFLAEVIKQVHKTKKNQWSRYVEEGLIPRLHGFELLMASYAMCHVRLNSILSDLGYEPTDPKNAPRLSIYLTDSLEQGTPKSQVIPFLNYLSKEAEGANAIKTDGAIMCVIGNPPYNGKEPAPKDKRLLNLHNEYKMEPGTNRRIKEMTRFLNDLYVQFFRMSTNLIEVNSNGGGIVAFITNNGYLENPTFRGMRWHLMKTFDKIWVLDLHGSTIKQEKSPNGEQDQNVFDIKQGVSIIVAARKPGDERSEIAEIWRGDLWGDRQSKYDTLDISNIFDLCTEKLNPKEEFFLFCPLSEVKMKEYNNGIFVTDIFLNSSNGCLTKRDKMATAFTEKELINNLETFLSQDLSTREACDAFGIRKVKDDKIDWDAERSRNRVSLDDAISNIEVVDYKPFDRRKIVFHPDLIAGISSSAQSMKNLSNVALVVSRQAKAASNDNANSGMIDTFFIVENIPDHNLFRRGGGAVCPLHIARNDLLSKSPESNIHEKVLKEFSLIANIRGKKVKEIDIFDYVYGVLHSIRYREIYDEYLKIDFPRIPWPKNADIFWDTVKKGTRLRLLHLMVPKAIGQVESVLRNNDETGVADCIIQKVEYNSGKVWINSNQYFDQVDEVIWNYSIGGFEPAKKWLRDRKGRYLGPQEQTHYGKIVKVLSETISTVSEIDIGL